MRRSLALGALLLFTAVAPAMAQMPIQIGFNGGTAVPFRNEKDNYSNGFHFGASAKVILIPLQIDAAIDHMGGKTTVKNPNSKDLNIASLGVTAPFSLTPSLLPVSVYVLGGAALYHHSSALPTKTDAGVNAGVGLRIGIPGVHLFAEGRGHAVFGSGNKITYLTGALGIRF